jgi:hypothetical protein
VEAGSSKLEAGSWRLEVRSWKLEVRDWKLEAGSWKLEIPEYFLSPFQNRKNTLHPNRKTNNSEVPPGGI